MKAILEQLSLNKNQSFHYRKIQQESFDASFHFHPEFELTYIIKGSGLRYIGSSADGFEDGDLVFLGANLPHCWVSETIKEKAEPVEAIVIQFKEDFFGKDFFSFPEMRKVKYFLELSKAGILFSATVKTDLENTMVEMAHCDDLKRFTLLLNIFHIISQADDYQMIDTNFNQKSHTNADNLRFQKVFSHIISNFAKPISLEEMASVANLSPTSFCRYFKEITQKTLVEVINGYRLEKACSLLRTTNLPLQQICFDCGFGDIPHFYRLFKKVMDTSPNKYRKANTIAIKQKNDGP